MLVHLGWWRRFVFWRDIKELWVEPFKVGTPTHLMGLCVDPAVCYHVDRKGSDLHLAAEVNPSPFFCINAFMAGFFFSDLERVAARFEEVRRMFEAGQEPDSKAGPSAYGFKSAVK